MYIPVRAGKSFLSEEFTSSEGRRHSDAINGIWFPAFTVSVYVTFTVGQRTVPHVFLRPRKRMYQINYAIFDSYSCCRLLLIKESVWTSRISSWYWSTEISRWWVVESIFNIFPHLTPMEAKFSQGHTVFHDFITTYSLFSIIFTKRDLLLCSSRWNCRCGVVEQSMTHWICPASCWTAHLPETDPIWNFALDANGNHWFGIKVSYHVGMASTRKLPLYWQPEDFCRMPGQANPDSELGTTGRPCRCLWVRLSWLGDNRRSPHP